MTCHPFSHNGMTGFVCTSGRAQRCACGNKGVFQCDWKVTTKQSGTCDQYLCGRCAFSPAAEKHLCPTHKTAWGEWRRQQREAGNA